MGTGGSIVAERCGNAVHVKTASTLGAYVNASQARILAINLLQIADAVENAPVPIPALSPVASPARRSSDWPDLPSA